jgi:anti-sigma regulatory factor (Ser/Thr protein kinase)
LQFLKDSLDLNAGMKFSKKLFLYGFDDELFSRIKLIAEKKKFVVLECSQLSQLTNEDETQAVLFMIQGEDHMKAYRQAVTDSAQHVFSAVLPEESREFHFLIQSISPVPICFYPIEDYEIKKVLSRLESSLDKLLAMEKIYAGLKNLSMFFSWRTDKLAISETCRQMIEVLQRAGFFHNSIQAEHAVLAMEEALVNAVEHGNLELDSSLRPESILEDDRYEILKQERLTSESWASRQINIQIAIDDDRASIRIQDQGQGFDTALVNKQLDEEYRQRKENIMDISGKGISLMSSAFDRMFYNEKGNEVTFIKYSTGRIYGN